MNTYKAQQFLSWFHHRVIVVAQIGNRAAVAAWTLKDTDALAVAQQALMEIVDAPSFLRKQRLQKGMRVVSRHLFANQTQAHRDPVDVHIYT